MRWAAISEAGGTWRGRDPSGPGVNLRRPFRGTEAVARGVLEAVVTVDALAFRFRVRTPRCGAVRLPVSRRGRERAVAGGGGAREYLTQERATRDLDRQAHITAAGWTKILRLGRGPVLHRPWEVAAGVRRELTARGLLR